MLAFSIPAHGGGVVAARPQLAPFTGGLVVPAVAQGVASS